MSNVFTAKRVREERLVPAAKEIRRLADLATNEKRAFSAEEQAAWDKSNKDYDQARAEVDRLERAEKVDADLANPASDPKIGRDDFNPKPKGRRAAEVKPEVRALALQGWCRAKLGKPLLKRHAKAIEAFNASQRLSRYRIYAEARQLQIRREKQYRKVLQMAAPYLTERRTLSAFLNGAGGYTIPEGFINSLEVAELAYGTVRQVADVFRTDGGGDLPWPTVNDTSNKGALLSESTQLTTSVDPTFGQVIFHAFKVTTKLVLIPAELLEDSAFDLETFLGDAFGIRFGRIEADLFTTGTGAAQPTGIVNSSALGVTAASATAISADELYKLKHSVDPAYRREAGYMLNDSTLLAIKLLKDGMGRYLWQPGLASGVPDKIDGDPLTINQAMASIATGNKSMIYGALRKYKIRDVGNVRIRHLVERWADYDQEGFVGFKRVDGKLLDAGTHPIRHLVHP